MILMNKEKIEIEIEKLKISDDKVFNVLNKFKNNMENKVSDLDKIVTSKENEWNAKLNKLNNDAKKIGNYIKENNDAKKNVVVEKEHDKILLEYIQTNEEKNLIKNKLKITENKLNKEINNIDKKNLIMN